MNKKIINAWCSYDIANSVYKLLINTALFPIYYHSVTHKAFNSDTVKIFSFELKNTVLYDYALATAFLFVAFVSPLLSGIADYGSKRKQFMKFFTLLGAASCILMYWFNGSNLIFGLSVIILAAIGYEGAVLFYNSFLPRIAPVQEQDKISARGYSWGYAGSMVLLIINLIIVMNYETFGFDNELEALQVAFIQVGVWWIGFSLIAFKHLNDFQNHIIEKGNLFLKGIKELVSVQRTIFKKKVTKRFLLSFFFYSMGLQTLMLVAIMFGKAEIGIEGTKLIITIIVLQILAILGAWFFGIVSQRIGNKHSIASMLVIWLLVCIGGYFVQTVFQFYILAAGVGLVMGGIQSQSRSTFSKLIPADTDDTASYFSFYNFSEKMAIVFGMFSFGFIEQITGSSRNSVIALGLYFIIAFVILMFTPFKKVSS